MGESDPPYSKISKTNSHEITNPATNNIVEVNIANNEEMPNEQEI